MGYSYSCVMALCPTNLNRDLQDISKHLIEEGELYVHPTDDSFGRELKTHVTALYGIRETDCDERVMKVIKEVGPLSFDIVGFGSFQEPKMPFDVIKLNIESPSLRALNAALVAEFPDNANSFPNYVPHITLAYVKKGLAPGILSRVEGQDLNISVEVEEIDISRNNGTHGYYEV